MPPTSLYQKILVYCIVKPLLLQQNGNTEEQILEHQIKKIWKWIPPCLILIETVNGVCPVITSDISDRVFQNVYAMRGCDLFAADEVKY